jgi:hypothetical protein
MIDRTGLAKLLQNLKTWIKVKNLNAPGGPVVGRIMRHPQAPEGRPWFWTITAREQPPSVYNHGYASSREQAMRYFKARWIA